ncbi:Transcription elongation factor GreB [hydrothermal vent metagenome]|uniref:Transcription elongation factor GreA n=1 Tax=hydrothermal vent metagenome TaxID=652676 RepID=A0A3B0WQ04_9ZZZZ
MGRYRPPQPVGSKYITAEGHTRLTEEHDYLWKKKRPEVTRILSAAAAEGDRSENAEYIYRKKELREIDARVRFLRKRLDDMVIVDRIPKNTDKVYFGAWVTIEDEVGIEKTYRIVGPDEFDPKLNYISMDSPMGKALLGKSLGDEFKLILDGKNGTQKYLYIINEISYNNDKN